MINKQDSLSDNLKNRNIRVTKQRLAILEVLKNANCPLTVSHIHSKLKKQFTQLRLSTIYRNLNIFVEKKIVRKMDLDIDNKESYFEFIQGKHHHHLVCVKCNEIIPLDCPLQEYEEKLSKKTNYTIIDHKIKIYGICPKCKNN